MCQDEAKLFFSRILITYIYMLQMHLRFSISGKLFLLKLMKICSFVMTFIVPFCFDLFLTGTSIKFMYCDATVPDSDTNTKINHNYLSYISYVNQLLFIKNLNKSHLEILASFCETICRTRPCLREQHDNQIKHSFHSSASTIEADSAATASSR